MTPRALGLVPVADVSQLPTFLRLIARALEDLALNEELRQARQLGSLAPVALELDDPLPRSDLMRSPFASGDRLGRPGHPLRARRALGRCRHRRVRE